MRKVSGKWRIRTATVSAILVLALTPYAASAQTTDATLLSLMSGILKALSGIVSQLPQTTSPFSYTGSAAASAPVSLQTFAQSQRIDSLDSTKINNAALTGGSITGASISASSIAVGGTATSTFSTGIDIVGSGCFAVNGVCLSVGGGAGTTAWGSITGTLSDQTDLQAALDARLTLTNWYATTTLPNLTTLTNLASVGTVTSGTWSGLFGAVSGASLTNLTAANIAAGTAGINISGNASTVTNGVYTTTFNGLFDTQLGTKSTTNIIEGSNQYFTPGRVDDVLNASTTIPKTSLANIWNPLQTFTTGFISNASSTIGSGALGGGLTVYGAATTTGNLIVQGSATSTFAHGIEINGGCILFNSVCLGGGSTDTVVRLGSIQTFTSGTNATYTTPANTSYIVVEVWGGGGGGGGGGNGGTTCFGTNATACTSPLLQATGGTGGLAADGGSGGIGSSGDVNLKGGGGQGGNYAGGSSAAGGTGGSAPRGGGGGSGAGTAINGGGSAEAGASFGGGGGGNAGSQGLSGGGAGGYSSKFISSPVSTYTYTVGSAGTAGTGAGGGVGGIIVYEYKTVTTGTDLAENYPVTDPSISAGEIVSFDSTNPIGVKRAVNGNERAMAGIISTQPGLLLIDNKDALGQRPVALSGRVPTKVNMENGSIAIGDRIALSSTPGVGMKAGPFDPSVGTAIEPIDHDGITTVFMDLQPGLDIHAITIGLLSTSTATTSTSATSAPGIAWWSPNAFLSVLFENISQWLASAVNGIGEVFADAVHTRELTFERAEGDEITVQKLCIGNICVTENQLETLLEQASVPASTPSEPPVEEEEEIAEPEANEEQVEEEIVDSNTNEETEEPAPVEEVVAEEPIEEAATD